jgi:hypothetical protein
MNIHVASSTTLPPLLHGFFLSYYISMRERERDSPCSVDSLDNISSSSSKAFLNLIKKIAVNFQLIISPNGLEAPVHTVHHV